MEASRSIWESALHTMTTRHMQNGLVAIRGHSREATVSEVTNL
jgi:hypothetical protein